MEVRILSYSLSQLKYENPKSEKPEIIFIAPRSTAVKTNKPRTAKVSAISKAQNLKGGPFGLCETPAGCKKFKKMKGRPFGDRKNFPKNFFNEIFEQCHSAEKCKAGTLCDFLTFIVLQNIKKIEGGTLSGKISIQEVSKSRIVPKKSVAMGDP